MDSTVNAWQKRTQVDASYNMSRCETKCSSVAVETLTGTRCWWPIIRLLIHLFTLSILLTETKKVWGTYVFAPVTKKQLLARFCELLADATTANAQLTSLSHRFRRSNCQTSSVWRRKRRSMWSSNFTSTDAFGGLTCRIVFLSIFSIYIFSLSVCVAARSGRLSNARESSGIHPLQSRHYCLGLNFRAGARGGNE